MTTHTTTTTTQAANYTIKRTRYYYGAARGKCDYLSLPSHQNAVWCDKWYARKGYAWPMTRTEARAWIEEANMLPYYTDHNEYARASYSIVTVASLSR